MLNKIRNTRLFWFIKNICCLFRCDIYKELTEINYKQEHYLEKHHWDIYYSVLKQRILGYFSFNPEHACHYQKEIEFLKHNDELIFPYSPIKKLENIDSGIDNETKLPFIVHQGKRLFFPTNMSAPFAKTLYKNFIETECILGGGYREKAPHQYESENVHISDGDILLDIGCAEALFALDHIEKVKKVYLIESDSYWTDALKATFKPYADKVVFVNKLISDTDSENTTTLLSLLKDDINESIFIKMDIEGYEQMVLKSSIDFLKSITNIKIACCTYHRQNDFDEISELLNNNGFKIEASDGYMIFPQGEINPPYFRKGIIRSQKSS